MCLNLPERHCSVLLKSTVLGTNSVSRSVVPNSLQLHGLQPTRLLCPWDSLGKKIGVSCHVLLQGIFPTQGLNLCLLCLLHCKWILYQKLLYYTQEQRIRFRNTGSEARNVSCSSDMIMWTTQKTTHHT